MTHYISTGEYQWHFEMSDEIANRIVQQYGLMASFDARIRQIEGRSTDGNREKIDRLWHELTFGKSGSDLEGSVASDFQLLKNQASLDCGLGLNQADYLLLREGGFLDQSDCADRQIRKWRAAEDCSRTSQALSSVQQSPHQSESPKFPPTVSVQQPEPPGERHPPHKRADNPRLLLVQKKLNFVDLTDSKPDQQFPQTSSNSEEERASAQHRQGAITFGKEPPQQEHTASKAAFNKSTPPMLAKHPEKDFGDKTTHFNSEAPQDRDTPKSYLRLNRQFDSVPPALHQASFVRKNPTDPRSKWFESRQLLQPEQVQEFELEEEAPALPETLPRAQPFVTQSQALGKTGEIPAMGSFERLEIRDLKAESGSQAPPGTAAATQDEAHGRVSSAQTIALLFEGALLAGRSSCDSDLSSAARSCHQVSPFIIEQRLSCVDYPDPRIMLFDQPDAPRYAARSSNPGPADQQTPQSSRQSDGLNLLLPTSSERAGGPEHRPQTILQSPAEQLQGTRIFPSQTFPPTAPQQPQATREAQQASDLSMPSETGVVAATHVQAQQAGSAGPGDRRGQEARLSYGTVKIAALFDSKSKCFTEKSPDQQRGSLASDLKAGMIQSEAASGLKSNASPARFLLQTPPNAVLLHSHVVGRPESALKESLLLTGSQQKNGIDIPCVSGGHLHYSSLAHPKKNSLKSFDQPVPSSELLRLPPVEDTPLRTDPCHENESGFKNKPRELQVASEAHPTPCLSSDSNRTPIRVTPSSIKLEREPPAENQTLSRPALSGFDANASPK